MTTKTFKNIFDAAEKGDIGAVKYYVETRGFQLSGTDYNNQTVAHIAAKHGNLKLLRYVLKEKPFIHELCDIYNKPVIYRAVQKGSLDMVKYLIDEVKVNVTQKYPQILGNTVVHFAAELGKLTILKYLVEEKRADVNTKNDSGETPLFFAAQEKRLRVIKYLLDEQKADLTVLNSNKENIMFTVIWKNDLSLARYFLRKGIELDVDQQNDSGDTILNRATKLRHIEFVQFLVEEMKADVNIPDNLRRTPLHVAAELHNIYLVSYFVEHGADITLKNAEGKTAFEKATDFKVKNYLEEAEGKLSRNRDRRSISEFANNYIPYFEHSLGPRLNLRIPNECVVKQIEPSTQIGDVLSSHLKLFLILSHTCFRTNRKTKKNQSNKFSLPCKINLPRKTDPIVSDVILSSEFEFR